MEKLHSFQTSDGATKLTKQEEAEKFYFWEQKETRIKGEMLACFRRPETVRQLSEDLELADVTINAYVMYFKFGSKSVNEALRSFLRAFWPEDELKMQHQLIAHFSYQYVMCNEQPLTVQPAVYNVSWAMIMLNADLHSNHRGRKMTCQEFIDNLNNAICEFQYPLIDLKNIYKSIKKKPLYAFRVKTRDQAVGKNEISTPEDSGCKSSVGTDNNPTTTVHKTGSLICKRVLDKNGRKTRKGRRAWKPFTAVLKGMDLYLQDDSSESDQNAIRLHHAVADPVDHRNRPHVLCLRTADSRLFYFQAESEVEQTSWVAIINLIAARYSAPPLTSASHDINTHHPQVLPSFPTPLSLEQQLEHHKDRLQRLSLPLQDGVLAVDYMEQEVKRYTTYVRALQDLVVEEDVGEVSSV